MSIQKSFKGFHDKIKLGYSDTEYSTAKIKDSSITAAVKAAFKDEGYSVVDDFIQGSFSTHTAIKSKDGDFDIDRAVVIDYQDSPDNPIEPKKVVLDVLEKRGFKNAKIKKPCVTADYKSENLHIDFPIYRNNNGTLELAVGKANSNQDNREWAISDPKGLRSWIKDSSTYGNSAELKQQQFNRLVRYVKRWRDHKFTDDSVRSKVYSIGLTVMLKADFVWALDDDGYPDDLKALRDTISSVISTNYFRFIGVDQYKVQVMLPKAPYRDIFDGSSTNTGSQLRNKLNSLKSKLDEAIAETDNTKKCQILNKLFGDDFEIPDDTKGANNIRKAVYSSAGAVGTSQGA
ncbi:conserved hypothetical protein [Shewanella halifaxensis HAW-EB4]|uniref:Cyclic GMP-AMP synthase n=1 Tax=Shewanella halifaxensis (strain HAW-EB4) TaxID=458817 RepID=B0TQW1_SHEHH|nr:nucleotidyltransferase [Shewanella halifaxensis]ABZ76356.1 conserved hypothetical protein [Shewanella halifaxensis HAW-EB4]